MQPMYIQNVDKYWFLDFFYAKRIKVFTQLAELVLDNYGYIFIYRNVRVFASYNLH